MLSRRNMLGLMLAASCGPAIVRASSLMKLGRVVMPTGDGIALMSVAHPENEAWFLLHQGRVRDLCMSGLETVEMEFTEDNLPIPFQWKNMFGTRGQ